MGKTDLKAVFVDGTKLESRAGRYTLSGGEAAGPSKGKNESPDWPEHIRRRAL